MTDEPRHPEVEAYIRRITSKAGKAGALVTNAKLTPAKRRKAGKKAAATLAEKRGADWVKKRASEMAAARWAKRKKGQPDG